MSKQDNRAMLLEMVQGAPDYTPRYETRTDPKTGKPFFVVMVPMVNTKPVKVLEVATKNEETAVSLLAVLENLQDIERPTGKPLKTVPALERIRAAEALK